jgi:hypothetical protein
MATFLMMICARPHDPWSEYAIALQVVEAEKVRFNLQINAVDGTDDNWQQIQSQAERFEIAKEHLESVQAKLPNHLASGKPFRIINRPENLRRQ